jgi:four helix bundle protein
MKKINSWRELEVYQKAYEFQQAMFHASKTWPREEKYALIDQIRRASRSIGANIAESWAKRRYPAHFLSKLTDADAELQECYHWLDTAFDCEYIDANTHRKLSAEVEQVGRQLGSMINRHESFCF